VTEVLGEIDDPGMEIEIAVRKYEVPHRFSPETLAQTGRLPDKVRPADKKNRIDLTDVALVTIDGEDARDFDDAVYCEPASIGRRGKSAQPNGWRLLVAIADVSHYVKPGEALDTDAYERATSVYFPRRVLPMLPEKLSNGLCSLNPNEDRLAMVCDMLIDADGEIHAYQFYPAVMHSQARFTYTEVAAILANTKGPEARMRKQLVPALVHLHEVYRALLKARARRGAVDFETTETQIVCDEAGRIEKIVPRTRNDAHRLIEEAMLAANVCSADFIQTNKHPSLYRVHEGPTPEKLATLQSYLKALGLGLSISDDPKPAEYQAIAQSTAERADAQQIHSMLLRSMQQAIYTPLNSGHFGLAYPAYTHFTSPIRRYPDLLVHRVIKALLDGRKYALDVAVLASSAVHTRKPRPTMAEKAQAKLTPNAKSSAAMQAWEAAGAHCSANERRADEASRDVEAWLKCKFMREHLGEIYSGTVTAATTFGLFVTLDELYVEGLVHISELGGEYYRFDEARQELRGERTGMKYAAGSRLRVQVSRVDLDARKIDFRLVTDDVAAPPRSGRGARSSSDVTRSAIDELAQVKSDDRAQRHATKKATAKKAPRGLSARKKSATSDSSGRSTRKSRR
jgi:ribonuclease R